MTGPSPSPRGLSSAYDVVCFSHLRWDFVYQRPQHLMSRFARGSRVFFIEEPIHDAAEDRIDVINSESSVYRLIPHLSPEGGPVTGRVKNLLRDAFERFSVDLVLYADDARPRLRTAAAGDRLRLHGRIIGIPRGSAGAASE